MLNSKNIRQLIIQEIQRLLAENGRQCEHIDENALLTNEVGLDSLAFASLFIFVEDRLGVDPFAEKINIVDIRTLGDLIQLCKDSQPASNGAQALR
jgi:acyl carrier protein